MVRKLLAEGSKLSLRQLAEKLSREPGISVKKSLVGEVKLELSREVTPPPCPTATAPTDCIETNLEKSPSPPIQVVPPLPSSMPDYDSMSDWGSTPTGSIPADLGSIPSDDSSAFSDLGSEGSIPGWTLKPLQVQFSSCDVTNMGLVHPDLIGWDLSEEDVTLPPELGLNPAEETVTFLPCGWL